MKNFSHIALLILLGGLAGCASNYQVVSTPSGASVFYDDPTNHRQIYMGVTPLAYSKAALPQSESFMLVVTKKGFKTESLPLAVTDESKTVVSVFLKPVDPDDKKQTSEIDSAVSLLLGAQKLLYQRRFHAAILELDKILADKPDLAEAHAMKGTSYYLLNELPSAIASWKTALKLAPNHPEIVRMLDSRGIHIKPDEAKK